MIEIILLSDKFKSSDEVSNLQKKLIIAFGCDKDEIATSMLVRIANREKGNSSQYCQTLAMIEKAEEKWVNLKDTILQKGAPVTVLLQNLLDNKLFAFTIVVKNKDGLPIKSNCLLLDLFQLSVYVVLIKHYAKWPL